VHEAITRDLSAVGALVGSSGAAAVAAHVGVSATAPYRWADPDADYELSVMRAGMIAREFGVTAVAEWLALCAGCRLVPLDGGGAADLPATIAALGTVVADLADGHVSDEDLTHIDALVAHIEAIKERALDARRAAAADTLRVVRP
jgi:hypothetical protein